MSGTEKTPALVEGGGPETNYRPHVARCVGRGHEPWRNDTAGKEGGESGWFAILNKAVEGDLTGEVTLELRPSSGEAIELNRMALWTRRAPGSGNRWCRGPEAGPCLAF